jgi:hypothetical protein
MQNECHVCLSACLHVSSLKLLRGFQRDLIFQDYAINYGSNLVLSCITLVHSTWTLYFSSKTVHHKNKSCISNLKCRYDVDIRHDKRHVVLQTNSSAYFSHKRVTQKKMRKRTDTLQFICPIYELYSIKLLILSQRS